MSLEAAYQGRGAFLLLTGEPGIGKTCLAEEFASAAEKRGAHVVWGRCSEREGAPELWPWVQVLRTCIRALDTGNPRSMTGKGVLVDIAQVVPELREFLPELPAPPALDPTSVRFRLSDSVTTFLKNAGTPRQPLVVILDDLHWADRPSLQLLEELARSLPGGRSYLLLVGIYRDTEVGHEHPLTWTSKRAAEPPIPLRGFSEPELTNFIALTSGLQLPEGLIKTIHERTGGNPFLASEIVRALPADGHLDRSGTLTASPDAEPRYWIKQRAPTYRVRKPTSALPPAKARFVQLRVEDFMSLGARSARAR